MTGNESFNWSDVLILGGVILFIAIIITALIFTTKNQQSYLGKR